MNEEDLIRIEQKLDLIIFALQDKKIMHKSLPQLVGLEEDICALCRKPIQISVNPSEGVLVRSCGCKLPKRAFKITLIDNTEKKDANSRTKDSKIPPKQEK